MSKYKQDFELKEALTVLWVFDQYICCPANSGEGMSALKDFYFGMFLMLIVMQMWVSVLHSV